MATKVQKRDPSQDYSFLSSQVNKQLEVLCGQLNHQTLPDFGSDMLLFSTDHIIAATVAHRVTGKFQKPDATVAKRLHEECISSWLSQEAAFKQFSWDNVSLRSKSVLYRARELLKTWLRDFKQNRDVIEFTPGETFVSAHGRVSMFQKIRNKDAWTVTHDAFEDFARLVYNTRWLKRVAKTFFHKLNAKQQRMIYSAFKEEKHVGYAIFRHRFLNEVVTLVHGGRFASVEKNNEKRRAIIVAPLGNMLLQRTVANPLRCILSLLGNDLEIGQHVHRATIRLRGKATVDFSNASDSNLCKVVYAQFPSKVSALLRRYRDPMVLVDQDYVLPEKLSSMGCGFTFEVMTLLLLSVARVLDPTATVYGDDVIISNDHARQFTEVMSEIMWKVNEKKTFIDSPFRESCGSFYHDEYGYITCFDFHWCENLNDALITINKLKIIADSNVPIIGNLFRSSYEVLIRKVPASLVGPCPPVVSDPDLGYAMAVNANRIQKRSAVAKALWVKHKERACELVERFNWNLNEACLIERPMFVNEQASKAARFTSDTARIAYYFYSGMVSVDSIRGKGSWRSALYLVCPEGMVRLTCTSDESKRWLDCEHKQVLDNWRHLLWWSHRFVRNGIIPQSAPGLQAQ